jgi:hypothetical protein
VGRPAAPAMQKALKGHPSLETEKRLRELLAALDKRLTPEELRLLRAVQAVERAGTPEARDLLRGWAGGAAGALLTEEARAALARMGGRRQPAGRPEE